MRISTGQLHQTAIDSMLLRQSELSKTQLQVATGKRVVKPSDDPVASASSLSLKQSKAVTERYQVNADAARARLGIEEGTLTGVNLQIHRVRELAIQGNNASVTDIDRKFLAKELYEIRDELLGLANTKDNNGEYLFAGHQGQAQPFSKLANNTFQYDGDDGQRFLQIGPTRRVADADPGSAVFVNIRNGNGVFQTQDNLANTGTGVIDAGSVVNNTLFADHSYQIDFVDNAGVMEYTVTDTTLGAVVSGPLVYSDGASISFDGIQVVIKGAPADSDSFTISPSDNQDLFQTVQNLIDAFEADTNTGAGRARLNNAVNRTLANMDQSLDNVLNIRAGIGARLNAIDSQGDNNENFILQVSESLSILNDLDYAEAVSRLNRQLTGLQAAQQSFVKVQGLSLFNYIG